MNVSMLPNFRYCYVVKPSPDGTWCVPCESFTYCTTRHDAWHRSMKREET